uniref:Presenilin n=1 Tax=Panagrellus redivivus TaxID=6233 RepID=A0A7E4USX3_PANRE
MDALTMPFGGMSEAQMKMIKEMKQASKIVIPVVTNQLITLAGWYFVYNCETDDKSFAYYLLDARHNYTTGSDVYDGAVNGLICVCLLALMSFFMLLVAMYNFRKIIQAWLGVSCLLIVFGISAMFFRDLLRALNIEDPNWILTAGVAQTYGTGGVITFFTNAFPLWMHQAYVVTNCSLVSLYYLRMLPAHTTWFLLGAIIVWDAFAVLAPQGPLNLITGVAEDYSDTILRFLMFTAEIQSESKTQTVDKDEKVPELVPLTQEEPIENENSDAIDAECTTADQISDSEGPIEIENDDIFVNAGILPIVEEVETSDEKDAAEEVPKARTAKDALDDDNSIRLGLGDFVFYSVLVGKAAASGSILATIAAMLGVILGLVLTLTVFAESDETMPALPCSIALGMAFHFQTLYLSEPMLYYLKDIILYNIIPLIMSL